METNTLILTVGLPRSGKSTWAKKQGCPIVNPDSIRIALHGKAYIAEAEPLVWAMALYMVKALFLAGHTKIIVDATNNTPKRRGIWKNEMWVTEYKVFDISKEECIERARNTDREDLIPVIERMDVEKDYTDINKTNTIDFQTDNRPYPYGMRFA